MIHPVFQLIASRPQLLAEHAAGYGELLSAEVSRVKSAWQRRVLLLVTGVSCIGVTAVLAGVAVMLWVSTGRSGASSLSWVLIAVPLAPGLLGLWCLMQARRPDGLPAFAVLGEQWQADLSLLREAGAR